MEHSITTASPPHAAVIGTAAGLVGVAAGLVTIAVPGLVDSAPAQLALAAPPLVAGAALRTVPERELVEFFRVLGGGVLVLAGVAGAMLAKGRPPAHAACAAACAAPLPRWAVPR